MTDHTQLVDRYIGMWNEQDRSARRALIPSLWTEDATYLDPALNSAGHEAIDEMVGEVHARYPGHRFRRTGPVDGHNDRLRFPWELAPEGEPPLVKGIDIAAVVDGRLQSVVGFFDAAPG